MIASFVRRAFGLFARRCEDPAGCPWAILGGATRADSFADGDMAEEKDTPREFRARWAVALREMLDQLLKVLPTGNEVKTERALSGGCCESTIFFFASIAAPAR